MTTKIPDVDIAAYLNGLTVNSRVLVSGTNLFATEPSVGKEYAQKSIFVWGAPGPAPVPYMGNPGTRGSVYYPRIQVRVRGLTDARAEAKTTAYAIRTLLHRATISGYVSLLCNESYPIYLGEREHGGHEFGWNFDAVYHELDLQATALPIYYGVSSVGIDTEAEILALDTTVSTTRAFSFTDTSGVGEYHWYAYPASFGAATFSVNGFVGGVSLISAAITVGGIAYRLYRTANPNLGSIDLVAS